MIPPKKFDASFHISADWRAIDGIHIKVAIYIKSAYDHEKDNR